ncbi:beta family protein [Paracoccus sp. (in: a-proteobacteria)]|uniref:beta family protein n=1 Tax=Paracoccus sp. TaxID=267 RepID=UPI00289D322F|nr:beta family protein [Paracoccus sp. (in: a-proteobacteria)]
MEVTDYLVTLCIRRAELSGLKQLPGSTKDRLTPLVLLAPWMATSPLSKAIDKFEEAYSGRPYFIDVDSYYDPGIIQNQAKEAWAELAKRPADLQVWQDLLLLYPNANPCLLMAGSTIESARAQIIWAREHDRTFCLRMNMAPGIGPGIPNWMPTLIGELSSEGAVDYAVVFDFGAVDSALDVAPMAAGYITGFLKGIPAEIPIAVCCTTFPSDFTPFDGVEERSFSNRELMAQIRQATNHPRIVYGDWGSTKPRSYGHASTPKNRIDYPTDNGWVIARDKDDPVSFQTAAKRIIEKSRKWTGGLGVWGEQLIEGAAAGQAFAIDTMPKMYSARINIHLHRQAFYGHLPPPEALDEAWSDDEL